MEWRPLDFHSFIQLLASLLLTQPQVLWAKICDASCRGEHRTQSIRKIHLLSCLCPLPKFRLHPSLETLLVWHIDTNANLVAVSRVVLPYLEVAVIHEGVIELPPTCPFLYVPPYSFQVQEDGPEEKNFFFFFSPSYLASGELFPWQN